jgi:hypothetical protein
LADYGALGGYMDHVRPLESVAPEQGKRRVPAQSANPWPLENGSRHEST